MTKKAYVMFLKPADEARALLAKPAYTTWGRGDIDKSTPRNIVRECFSDSVNSWRDLYPKCTGVGGREYAKSYAERVLGGKAYYAPMGSGIFPLELFS